MVEIGMYKVFEVLVSLIWSFYNKTNIKHLPQKHYTQPTLPPHYLFEIGAWN